MIPKRDRAEPQGTETYLLNPSGRPRAFWSKQHAEYHLPRWTNWAPLSLLPVQYKEACMCVGVYICTWSVWYFYRGVFCGFPVNQKIVTNKYCFMNKWKENWFPLFSLIEERCESSCKQRLCQTGVLQKKSITQLHPSNQQKWYALYFDCVVTHLLSLVHLHTHTLIQW